MTIQRTCYEVKDVMLKRLPSTSSMMFTSNKDLHIQYTVFSCDSKNKSLICKTIPSYMQSFFVFVFCCFFLFFLNCPIFIQNHGQIVNYYQCCDKTMSLHFVMKRCLCEKWWMINKTDISHINLPALCSSPTVFLGAVVVAEKRAKL